jgi:hypothetical protein
MAEDEVPEVNITVDEGLTETSEVKEGSERVENVDDIGTDLKEKGGEKKPPEKKEAPADKGESKVEEDIKAIRSELDSLKKDKKNLQIALHKERQGKKEAPKDDVVLTDKQLQSIIEENPDNPEVLLRVTRYMAEKIAKGEKAAAISEVDVSQKSKAVNKLLLDRYPALADDSSEMRTEIDQVKESLGIADSPFGDAFAVGVRVVENLPTLLTNAYEKGKKDALGTVAEKKRGDKIDDTKLSPKGSGKSTVVTELTADQSSTAKQLNLSPSAAKIYAKLVGKQPKTLSVEE